MNQRKNHKNKSSLQQKPLLITLLSFIVLMSAGFGSYVLVAGDSSDTEIRNEEFLGKSYAGFVADETFGEEQPIVQEAVGSVEDARPAPVEQVVEPVETVVANVQPEEVKEVEETNSEEAVEIPIEVPEPDLSLMVANAKTHVYTIYTDLERGSGFLFNEQGDILTNAHVVKDASYITVKNSNGQEFNGKIIGISSTEDIALVRVAELAGKQPLAMEQAPVEAGTKVFAIGSPNNISNTSSEGEITATGMSFADGYQYNNLYEMNAKISKGSSGGPLIDAGTERILGINSIILADQPEIGYAIPIYTVLPQLNDWVRNPIVYDDWEEVLQTVEDAFFDEQLLKDFVKAYYELIPYTFNDPSLDYHERFLLPGSPGETAGKAFVEENMSPSRTFEAVSPEAGSVTIGEDQSTVQANATFTYHDAETDEVLTIEHSGTFTIVIDEYGDYQITNIE